MGISEFHVSIRFGFYDIFASSQPISKFLDVLESSELHLLVCFEINLMLLTQEVVADTDSNRNIFASSQPVSKSYRNAKFQYTHDCLCLLQIPEWVAADWFRKKVKDKILNFSEHLKTFKTVKNSQRTRKMKIIRKCENPIFPCLTVSATTSRWYGKWVPWFAHFHKNKRAKCWPMNNFFSTRMIFLALAALERGDRELFRTSKIFEIHSATAENESFTLRDVTRTWTKFGV